MHHRHRDDRLKELLKLQIELLFLAVEHGLLDVPREVRGEVGDSTYECIEPIMHGEVTTCPLDTSELVHEAILSGSLPVVLLDALKLMLDNAWTDNQQAMLALDR